MATKGERTVTARAVREANNRIIGSSKRQADSGRFVASELAPKPGYTIVTVRKIKHGDKVITADRVKLAGERAMSKFTKK